MKFIQHIGINWRRKVGLINACLKTFSQICTHEICSLLNLNTRTWADAEKKIIFKQIFKKENSHVFITASCHLRLQVTKYWAGALRPADGSSLDLDFAPLLGELLQIDWYWFVHFTFKNICCKKPSHLLLIKQNRIRVITSQIEAPTQLHFDGYTRSEIFKLV